METLYRKNNQGQPCFWNINIINDISYSINHGIVGKKGHSITIASKDAKKDMTSKYKQKLKQGYVSISDVRDDGSTPVEEGMLYEFLTNYLNDIRFDESGGKLSMLAKVYKEDIFNKQDKYLGQFKINGLRCRITAEKVNGDMFKDIKLTFRSREGTVWNSLSELENHLLSTISPLLLKYMVEENWSLDGELYIPNKAVNEINSAVKNTTNPLNKELQYWCYDLDYDGGVQQERIVKLESHAKASDSLIYFTNKDQHFNNKKRFVVLPHFIIKHHSTALSFRNQFIELGFEGLILRNPNMEYQHGKRNSAMFKFKSALDGIFKVIDIYKEGIKREVPLILCKNDVNDHCFETHITGNTEYQISILNNKNEYIGKNVEIKFGERSGVNKFPFHISTVKFIE